MSTDKLPRSLAVEERGQILGSLTQVGHGKIIGYLPWRTVTEVLGLTTEELAEIASSRGLVMKWLGPNECCIKAGALYVYDSEHLAVLLDTNADVLTSACWPKTPDQFVRAIAAEWLPPGHPVLPIVQAAFATTR